jgi:nucleotide-binding universal stress UspA family protein
MTYKTILAHCNDTRRIEALLVPAIEMADRHDAHLIALSVVPPALVLPAGAPGAPDVMIVDEYREEYRKNNAALKAVFDDATRGKGFSAEWRERDAAESSVGDVVLNNARCADIVFASQTDSGWSGSRHLDVADRLAIESGRPVVIIPRAGKHHTIGSRIVVGWNGRREAARAVFDAVPLLEQAKGVRVLCINPQSESETPQEISSADICAALSRQGIPCESFEIVPARTDVGTTLMQCATDCGADLLVMGCYGHSRLREFMFGGASRYALTQMKVPVLMAH